MKKNGGNIEARFSGEIDFLNFPDLGSTSKGFSFITFERDDILIFG